MKQRIFVTGFILLSALVLAIGARAQIAQMQYNPYTGLYSKSKPTHNQLAGGQTQHANPFTGKPAVPSSINPYTGKPRNTSGVQNPLTGAFSEGKLIQTPTSPQVYQWPKGKYPIKGMAGPGLEPFDQAIQTIMARHGIPGASLAVAKDGKLVYAKGFGWADLAEAISVNPLTLFGLASLSKPITAIAILLLVERGQLDLDDRVYDILAHIKAPPGSKLDPRAKDITVRHLLNHTGGWNREVSGDPTVQSPLIAQAMNVAMPITDEQFISYMKGQPLDFAPGTENHYSNVGYIMLGKIIEKVSGRPYEEFVQKNVLQPVGVQDAFTNIQARSYKSSEARRYLAGTSILLPPMELPMVKAAGGWSASAVDMVKLLTRLDGSRGKAILKEKTFKQMLTPPPKPLQIRKNGSFNGLGWPTVFVKKEGYSYLHDGNFHGMRTFMKRSDDGVNWALLFNVSMQPDMIDSNIAKQVVNDVRVRIESFESYPQVDLFAKFD